MTPRPYALLAELTYQCPLHCPYCSNPPGLCGDELETAEWERVIREAAALGALQVGFSGGEPLVRRDLATIVAAARACHLYTNLISSGVGLSKKRADELRAAGLDSIQLSFQADEPSLADSIAGARAHEQKLKAARTTREAGFGLSLNFVIHRANIGRLAQMIALAEELQAERIELANAQYYGWAFLNRRQLLPTRSQIEWAVEVAKSAKVRLAGKMDIFYVLPDYFENRPKPCLGGWGQKYLTVNPRGDVLPCPTASAAIPDLSPENVREQSLAWIWTNSESFNRFRGVGWMPELCRTCPLHEIDFGGCRCQAAMIAGDAAETDPVCSLSAFRGRVDEMVAQSGTGALHPQWQYRENPTKMHAPVV